MRVGESDLRTAIHNHSVQRHRRRTAVSIHVRDRPLSHSSGLLRAILRARRVGRDPHPPDGTQPGVSPDVHGRDSVPAGEPSLIGQLDDRVDDRRAVSSPFHED